MAKHKGLSENEVLILRKKFGENLLPSKGEPSPFFIFYSQFKSPLVYILIFVALISLCFKEFVNAILIGTVIFINVLMGFFQEFSAQKTLSALRKILKPRALVIRDGKRTEIETKDLVPGDLVLLSAGNRVPADGKLVEGVSLLVNEAILTGEEEAVGKNINEGQNILFMGTTVVAGKGIFKAERIGELTEMGKIGHSLAEIKKEETPLQIKLENFSKRLAFIVIGICVLIFLIGIFYRQDPFNMLKVSVILAVAAIPEGLPIVITVILALGMRRILKRNGLVKKLLSIETLGSTSVICTDKTGTLTEGIMKVAKTDFRDKLKALFALTVTNDQRSNLEVAIWEYIKKEETFNPQEVFDLTRRIYEEPFDSEKKYTFAIVNIEGKDTAFIAGAPEIILAFCDITEEEKTKILSKIEEWAGEGLRVLGIIYKEGGILKEKKGFSYLGAVGIRDPIREGAKEAIEAAKKAGIKVKIVTGDYRKTAEKIADLLGFNLKPENILEGSELEKISDEELKNKIENISLFTRVTPHQKMKIIKALQERGETVAMTGDGVNDAPALKKADIGVVVGSASDVAKEAGDLVLLDNNFKTIVAACEEGRLIFANIKKVVGYILSNSFAEIFLIFGAMVLNFPAPLTIVQILWIHLVCDGPPDIMLGFEPKEKGIMQENPKDIKKESILPRSMMFLIFAISCAVGFTSLFYFWYFNNKTGDLKLARTLVFASIGTVSLVYIFAFKNLKKLIIHTENFFHNLPLFLSVGYGFLLIFSAVYIPGLNKFLGTVPLEFFHWVLVFAVALISTLLVEMVKIATNK
ncbi:MAG: cation-translocating P-type ATPase [Candidatus Pacebacteria bacterium]|nr:cation-translocating P-type ATPase [Candidatus Paceibacterota bacterium]